MTQPNQILQSNLPGVAVGDYSGNQVLSPPAGSLLIATTPAPSSGQVPVWNGSAWVPGAGGGGGSSSVTVPLGNITGAQPTTALTNTLNEVTCTLTGNASLTFTATQNPTFVSLEVYEDATGNRTLTINGLNTQLNESATDLTKILLAWDGTNWTFGSVGVGVMSINGQTPVAGVVTLTAANVQAAPSNQTINAQATANPNTAATPWNAEKLTGLAPGSAQTDAVNLSQVETVYAETPTAGVAMINGTQTIITATAPNDGNLHTVTIKGCVQASSQTGGAMNVTVTNPNGGPAGNQSIYAGTKNGFQVLSATIGANALVVGPGAVVTVAQNTAETAGSATVYAAISID